MILIPKYNQVVELGGTLALAHYRDGKLIDTRFQSNLVTTAGKKWIANRMTSNTPPVMTKMGLGGSTTPGALAITTPDATAQTLTSSGVYAERTAGARPDLTVTSTGTTQTVTYSATFGTTVAANCAIVEAAIFNAASGTYADNGNHVNCMLCITSFQVVNKGANDTIAITWTVTIQ